MSCVSTPTATQFSTSVATSVTTSFSTQVTTLAGTTSIDLSTSCLSSAAALSVSGNSTDVALGSCVSSTVITSTTVIGGAVSTAQVPFEVTNFVTTSVATNTLFAPCTTDNSGPTTTPTTTITTPTTTTSSTTSTSTSASATTEFSQSLTTVLTTPATTFTTAQSSTLDDGSVTLVTLTLISTLPPTSSVQSTAVPIATMQSNNAGNSASSNMGAIIGGSVGGFLGLLGIVGAIWYFCRRRTNWDDIFEKDYDEYAGGSKPLAPARGRMLDLEDEPIQHVNAAEANTEPKPYVYGLVGSASALSPPSLNAGLAPSVGSRPSLASHNRSSSMTPLMANGAPASRPGSGIDGNGGGLSPSPSFTPSASGGRSGSPGPLGVAIPTGPAFSMSQPVGGESPTSITAPRGALFIANQEEATSPPGSPASPGSAGSNNNRQSMSNVPGPSFAGAMASAGVGGAPPSAFTEKQRLQHSDSVSSHSVYSQASRAQSPPVSGKRSNAGQRRTSAGVVVHTDAGRAESEPSDQPPAYLD